MSQTTLERVRVPTVRTDPPIVRRRVSSPRLAAVVASLAVVLLLTVVVSRTIAAIESPLLPSTIDSTHGTPPLVPNGSIADAVPSTITSTSAYSPSAPAPVYPTATNPNTGSPLG